MQSEDITAGDGAGATVTPGQTVDEWRAVDRISKSSFYKLERLGLAPYSYTVPETKIKRITESHPSWRARMRAIAAEKAAKLETARARKLSKSKT